MTRTELVTRFSALVDGIQTTTIDRESVGRALDALQQARNHVLAGFQRREAEDAHAEERRIIQLYRDGKLVEKA